MTELSPNATAGGAAPTSAGAGTTAPVQMPGAGLPQASTQAEALAALDTLRANPLSDLARAITNRAHPEHAAVNAWQKTLYELAYPEEAAHPMDTAPAAADGYDLSGPAHLRNLPRDAEFESEARALFFNAGLTRGEVTGIVHDYMTGPGSFRSEAELPSPAEVAAGAARSERALRQIWGSEYEENMALANAAYKAAPISGRVREMLKHTGFGNNVSLIRSLAEAAKRKGYR